MPMPYPKELREGAVVLGRQGERPVSEIAKELGIAKSCRRNWLKPERIKAIRCENRKVYGAPCVYAELRLAHGIGVGRKRIERLMRPPR